jgi:hypothetical protein
VFAPNYSVAAHGAIPWLLAFPILSEFTQLCVNCEIEDMKADPHYVKQLRLASEQVIIDLMLVDRRQLFSPLLATSTNAAVACAIASGPITAGKSRSCR